MPTIASGSGFDTEESQDSEFKPLDAAQAQALRSRLTPWSPWRVLGGQVGVGVLSALAAGALFGSAGVGWSVAWGALAVVLPAAVFARGMARQAGAVQAGAALAGFFIWELVKIVLTVALLLAAPRCVQALNWWALVGGFVLTLKVHWVALWLHSVRQKPRTR